MSFLSFVLGAFDGSVWKWPWLGRKVQGLGGISLPVSMLKSFDFKTNTEVV